jgi:hypothetical protein
MMVWLRHATLVVCCTAACETPPAPAKGSRTDTACACESEAPLEVCSKFLENLAAQDGSLRERAAVTKASLIARGPEIGPSLLPLLWHRDPLALEVIHQLGVGALLSGPPTSDAEGLAFALTDELLASEAKRAIAARSFDEALREYALRASPHRIDYERLAQEFRDRPDVLEDVLIERYRYFATRDWQTSWQLLRALGNVGTLQSEGVLVEAARQKRSWATAAQAIFALEGLQSRSKTTREALEAVALSHWHISVREAAEAARTMQDGAARPSAPPHWGWAPDHTLGEQAECAAGRAEGPLLWHGKALVVQPLPGFATNGKKEVVAGAPDDPCLPPLPAWAAGAIGRMRFEGGAPWSCEQRGLLMQRGKAHFWAFTPAGDLRSELVELHEEGGRWQAALLAQLPVRACVGADAGNGDLVVGQGNHFASVSAEGATEPICGQPTR